MFPEETALDLTLTAVINFTSLLLLISQVALYDLQKSPAENI